MSGDMRNLRHLCGHSQPDFGEWVGLAPCMSPKGSLILRKKHGCKPAQKIAKNMSFLGLYLPRTTCLKMELRHPSPVFCLWHRWRKSRIEPCTSRLEYIHRIISPYITMHKSFTHTHIYIYICAQRPPRTPNNVVFTFSFFGDIFCLFDEVEAAQYEQCLDQPYIIYNEYTLIKASIYL